jgi:ABC-type multidrug transport system ATPase subunit
MLSIHQLCLVYPDGTRALDGVDLAVAPGMFGLLGPNGAGKSSLMRTVATLQLPTSGALRFGGLDILAEPDALRRTLGYLPQDFGVYPRVSARDLLDHLAVLKGFTHRAERRELVASLLAQVNLWDARDRAVAGFSGGMRQRFGIAQALIGRPRLVIVDEPTAGLDPEERNRFLDLLASLGDDRVVILSTHIVADVVDLCRRTAILAAGRILREGTPEALIEELDGRVWRKLVDRSELDALRDRRLLISTRLLGGRTVARVLAPSCPGPGFEPVAPGLEDAYFSALRR